MLKKKLVRYHLRTVKLVHITHLLIESNILGIRKVVYRKSTYCSYNPVVTGECPNQPRPLLRPISKTREGDSAP